MNHAPTSEQTAILAAATSSSAPLMVDALAGCGKTTTLEMIEAALPEKPVLLMAFNKKVADDAKKRLSSTTTVSTFNSLGHRLWAKETGRALKLNKKKTGDLFREYITTQKGSNITGLWAEYWGIISAVDTARTIGYIPSGHTYGRRSLVDRESLLDALDEDLTDLAVDAVDDILCWSIRAGYQGTIDFTDQIYLPALFGATFPQFPTTLVDEYQDLNPLNHVMIRKLVGDRRLIGVGDPNQNIYGFRGAAANGMQSAVDAYSMTRLPLSVSFRCPEKIVEAAKWRVPHFKWIKPGGTVLSKLTHPLRAFEDNAAILCRNNAPLFALAMRLLAEGRSVNLSGSEIGPKILATMKKLGDEDLRQPLVLGQIDNWLAGKLEKGSKTANDTAECMRVFATYGANLGEAMTYAKHLFEQSGSLTLSMIHRAKGLEWPTVYMLDQNLMRHDEQDRNLRYVGQTRAADTYIEVNSGGIV